MSSPNSRKPVSGPASNTHNDKSPNRPTVASAVPAGTGQGLVRTPSLRQTRLARKPTSRTSSSFALPDGEQQEEEETKSANAQLIAGLKEQVDRAEQASEQYRKQLEIMQQRLDEAAAEQTTGEERDYKRQTEIDRLRAEIRDLARERRELESAQEHERKLFEQERERQSSRELALQDKVHRLNEVLRTKGLERTSADRSGKLLVLSANSISSTYKAQVPFPETTTKTVMIPAIPTLLISLRFCGKRMPPSRHYDWSWLKVT